MAAAAPTASSRFLGLAAARAAPPPSAWPGANRSIAPIHLGREASSPWWGRPRNWRTATSSSPSPRSSFSQLTQVARWPVGAGPRGGQHEHDRDDRDRAERHPDRQRQGLPDRLAHLSLVPLAWPGTGPVRDRQDLPLEVLVGHVLHLHRLAAVGVLTMRPARVSRPHPHRVIPASAGQRTRADWHVMTGLPYLIRVVVPTLGCADPRSPFGAWTSPEPSRRSAPT